ncbi:MAG: zinc metallopeptidase [Ruminococcus flavefaciens]|nr:zinc metallopeptidase [Ruminococcus flavefaciens]MCM1229021.1 zinc metallopeptidase [Ruminococcus flavefaciens]
MDIILLLLMLVLPILAQLGVTSTFKKYSTVENYRGLTAEQVARHILDSNGLNHIRIERVSGNLTDHFSPTENVVRLSDSVYGKTSVSAIGVAAHECGHACQHAENYAPIVIRSKIVPVVNVCSRFWYLAFVLGLIISYYFVYLGIAMFSAVVIFQLVTLPTELDASHRALKILEDDELLVADEIPSARKVLTAAAMTYVVSLVTSILQLLRLLSRVKR